MEIEKKPPPFPAASRKTPLVLKLVLGCSVTLLIGMVALCGGAAYLGWWGWTQVDAYAQEFIAKGYNRQIGQVIDVPGPVNEPTVYTAQVVRVTGDVNADVAFMAQVVEIYGEVNGDIDFSGQVLHIREGAVIKGDIRVNTAQVVIVEGAVEGKISGSYGALEDRRPGALNAPLVPSPPEGPMMEAPTDRPPASAPASANDS
jgi:hypothetical protein